MKLYGLKNCDSCRAARKWLAEQGIDCAFHDLRADGLPPERLDAWLDAQGGEGLLNRRSTTWRQLSDADRERAGTQTGARALLLDNPTLIKRPVLEHSTGVTVGFSPAQYEAVLAGAD